MKPTEGKIQFKTTDGSHTDLATLKEDQIRILRTDIQMIFQDPFASLNPRMNILDLIGEPMLVNGLKNRKERTEKVAELLKSATESHNLPVIEEIFTNGGVTAIYSLFDSENNSQIQS